MAEILSLMLRLARAPSFVSKLASEPDLDLELLDQVLSLLEANHQAMLAQALTQVVESLEAAGASRRQGGSREAGTEQDGKSNPAKIRRQGEAKDVSDGTEDEDGGGRLAVTVLSCKALPELPGAAPGSAELEQQYTSGLEGLSVGGYDSTVARGYSRQFADRASDASGGALLRGSRAGWMAWLLFRQRLLSRSSHAL